MQYSVSRSLFSDKVCFTPFESTDGIQSHHWLTALFLRFFGIIVDIKTAQGNLHLNKYKFEQWKKLKCRELACEKECENVAPSKAIDILCATQYTKKADLELKSPIPAFSNALLHLQKAISLQVPQKPLYERRVSDLKYLQQKWNDPSQPQTAVTLEKLSQIIKNWKGKFPEGFFTFPKLERKITLLTSIIEDLKKGNPADLLNNLKEMPFADDRIKESIHFKDPLLEEMILQKNRVESEIAKNLMVKGQSLALSKAASLLHDKAEILLLDAEIADRISTESTEAEKIKRAEAEQELSRRVKEQEEAEKQRKLAEEQERLRKEQAAAEEEKQKKLAEEQEQAQRIEKDKAEKEKQEEEERKRIQQAKETAAKLNNEAIVIFKQMDLPGCLLKLGEAKEIEPDKDKKQNTENVFGAVKSLLDWCTQNAIVFKDIKTSLELSQTELKEELEKIKKIEIGPLSGIPGKENESLKKLKTIFEEYVKDCTLNTDLWTTFSSAFRIIFKSEANTQDPVLQKIKDILNDQDLVTYTIKYNTCKKMTKFCSDLYGTAVLLQFESHKQKAETKIKEAELEKKALEIEGKASEAFDKKDFALAVKLFGEAIEMHPIAGYKERLKKLKTEIEEWIKWMDEHQLKGLEVEQINKKESEIQGQFNTSLKAWSDLAYYSSPSAYYENQWKAFCDIFRGFSQVDNYPNDRKFIKEELLNTYKIPKNCLKSLPVLNNIKPFLEARKSINLYNAQYNYNTRWIDNFLCAEFCKLHKELKEEILKKKEGINKSDRLWEEGAKALERFDLALASIKIQLASYNCPIDEVKKIYATRCTGIGKIQAWCAAYKIEIKDLPKLRKTLIENLTEYYKKFAGIIIDKARLPPSEQTLVALLQRIQSEFKDKLDYDETSIYIPWNFKEIQTELYTIVEMKKLADHGISEVSDEEKLKHIPTKVVNYHFYNSLLTLLKAFHQKVLDLQGLIEERAKARVFLRNGELEKAQEIYVQNKLQDFKQLVKWKKEAGEGRKKEIEWILSMTFNDPEKEKFQKKLIDQLNSIKVEVESWKKKWIGQNKNPLQIFQVIKAYAEKIELLLGNEVKHPYTKEAFKVLVFDPLLCSYFPSLDALEGWDEPLHTLKPESPYEEIVKGWIIPVYHLYRKGLVVESIFTHYPRILEAEAKFNNEQLVETNNHLYGSLKARVECSFYRNGFELFSKIVHFQFAFSHEAILNEIANLRKGLQESQGLENGSRVQECEKALAEIRKLLDQNPLTKAEGGELVVERSVFYQKLNYYQNLKSHEKLSSEGLMALRGAVIAFLDMWFLVVMNVYMKLPENALKTNLEKGLEEWEKMSPAEQMSPRGTELKRLFEENFQV